MLQVKLSDSHLTVLIVSVWRTERLFGIQRRRKIWHEDRTCESAHANVSTSQTTWHANMCKCAFHFDFTHSHDVDKHTSIKKIITRNITYRYLSWLLIALFRETDKLFVKIMIVCSCFSKKWFDPVSSELCQQCHEREREKKFVDTTTKSYYLNHNRLCIICRLF